jgi:hypothetical protein
MYRLVRQHMWFFLIVGTIALVIVTVTLIRSYNDFENEWAKHPTVDPNDPILVRIKKAQAKWADRPFKRYRMIWRPEVGDCKIDVIIENEVVIKELENTCSSSTKGITYLLSDIRDRITNIQWINGIGCDLMVVHATFNKLGYPEKVQYVQEFMTPFNVGQSVYEKYRRRNIPCTLLGLFDYGYRIELLTPFEEF